MSDNVEHPDQLDVAQGAVAKHHPGLGTYYGTTTYRCRCGMEMNVGMVADHVARSVLAELAGVQDG